MKLFAVTGNPILFSKSPMLHRTWFSENKIDAVYTRLSAETAEEALQLAEQLGLSGLNVTAPFKERMVSLLDQIDPDAELSNSVNTIIFEEFGSCGFTTDPYGIVYALRGTEIKNAVTCIIGNGGAAKSARHALTEAGAASVTLIARSIKEEAISFSSPEAKKAFESATIVISTIPSDATVPEEWRFHKNAVLLDAIYSRQSLITKKAIAQNIPALPGIDWLIGQGQSAFSLFTNNRPVSKNDALADQLTNQKKKNEIVFLVGMMGSGKSSALKNLSELGYKTCDLDFEIEKKIGKKIPEIFSEMGENRFRELEHETLVEILQDEKDLSIVACGGGTPFYMDNAELLKQGSVFWIWCPSTVLAARIADNTSRPLLAGKSTLESLENILAKRFSGYAALSDLIISSTDRSAKDLADRIHYEISSTRKN